MSRPAVSFAAMSAAEADIERVATEIRRRVAELDEELTPVLPDLSVEEVERVQSARSRRDAAVADLCAVLGQIGTALGAARDAGLPSAYVRPQWS
jgi:uncharacterized protein YukE